MNFVDIKNPFYRPLWRRIVIVVSTGGWAAVEAFISRSGFWAVIFGAIFVFSLWTFIINWKEPPPEA